MKERQLVQKKLAKLIKQDQYKSCENSIYIDNTQIGPVNPFHKKVFQKRLKRSLQNINPNYSVALTNTQSQFNEDYETNQIVQKGHLLMQKLQRSVINQKIYQAQKFQNKNSKKMISDIMQGAKKVIDRFQEIVEKYITAEKTINSTQDSIFCTQNYQCLSTNSKQQDQTPRHQKYVKMRKIDENQSKKQKKQGVRKSVYESVLEQRKVRKNKNSRII